MAHFNSVVSVNNSRTVYETLTRTPQICGRPENRSEVWMKQGLLEHKAREPMTPGTCKHPGDILRVEIPRSLKRLGQESRLKVCRT